MPALAVAFDFNGTLSDDEPVLLRIYQELFAEHGRPLTEREYLDRLAGHSEEEIIGSWLGHVTPELVSERIRRYCELVADGATVYPEVREAVRLAAERVPVVIVSGAALAEIAPVVEASGLAPLVRHIVAADHVTHGKPDPEGYLRAAELLGIDPAGLLAFEDTEAGVASARASGAYVVGITRTLGAARLAEAHELADRIEPSILERLLV